MKNKIGDRTDERKASAPKERLVFKTAPEDKEGVSDNVSNPAVLLKRAADAAAFSYCPYSRFAVGAALLASDGVVYAGCNVESASYGLTLCAERTALFKAVSEGARRFAAIAITAFDEAGNQVKAPPCGAYLQALSEFCGGGFIVITGDGREIDTARLDRLLSRPFVKKESGDEEITGEESR